MNENMDGPVQVALGQVLAANAMLAALCSTHPNKQALLDALRTFDDMSKDVIRIVERQRPGQGQTMQDAYLEQLAGFRALLEG